MTNAKATFRWAESFFPFTRPLKYRTYNFATRTLGAKIEPEFRALGRLGPVGLALDIGGNWGQSIEAFRRCSSPGKIISFEPNRDLADRLVRRHSSDAAVDIHPVALGDKSGSVDLFVPRYRGFVYDGLASTLEAKARGWFNTSRMALYDPAKLTLECQQIEVRTLDSFNLAPDLVKIDVQGGEEAVVRGGSETFAAHRPTTIVESPSEEVIRMFAAFDMLPYSFDGDKLSPFRWQSYTAIFASRDSVARLQN